MLRQGGLAIRELAIRDFKTPQLTVSGDVGIIGAGWVVRYVLVLIVWLGAAAGAQAANIEVRNLEAGTALISVEGDLELADIDSFRNKVASLSKATVVFRSDGGSLLAGIRIGMLVRMKNFTTVVPDGAQCASACAIAWLGGAHRFIGTGSKVGFHAAYVPRGGGTVESGPGNAVLGAYLDQIGLPEEAIVYITQAPPSSMKWLSLEDAAERGIEVSLLPPADTPEPPQPPESSATAEQVPAQPGLAGRATGVVLALAARWSRPNEEMMRALDDFYGDEVFYHGKVVSRQAVLLDKQHFAERWPQRTYKIRPHSMTVNCNAMTQMCRVQGIMERELTNPKANTRSRDVANFDYSLARSGEELRISAETSTVARQPAAPDASNPLAGVQKGLEHLLAQVARLRPPGIVPEQPRRPRAPIPTSKTR
jgi:hypothetical protein